MPTETQRLEPSWLLKPITYYSELPLTQIANALANINRYCGNAGGYSVALHSLLVADLMPDEPRLKLLALLHDAHEAWIGDSPLPLKRLHPEFFAKVEREHDEHIWRMVGITPSQMELDAVAAMDKEACRIEMDLWPDGFEEPKVPSRIIDMAFGGAVAWHFALEIRTEMGLL